MKQFAAAVALASLFVCLQSSGYAATTVYVGDSAAIQRAVRADKGHVVVLNFWATWCGPCVAEYPALVKLDDNFSPKGVKVIAVSLDFPKDIATKVKPFVTSHNAHFTQYILRMGDPGKDIDSFDPTWQGDIPRTFIYDRAGKLVKTLSNGEQTYASFAAATKAGLQH